MINNLLLKQLCRRVTFAGCVLYFLFLQAQAGASTISVTSYRGGKKVNFGNVDGASVISRELKIEATSVNTSYQIKQIIIQPITSRKGVPLKDDVLSFYTVRGSNAKGSLYHAIKEPLAFKDELLYVSDSQGSSDSFKLVYIFEGRKLTTPGSFYGQIAYVLEPKAGETQTTIFDIEFNAQLEFEVKLEMLEKPLRLSTKSERAYSGYIDFHIKSSAGRRLDIYQRPEIFPSNDKGTFLPRDSIKFYISDSAKGEGEYKSPAEIGRRELLIYTSREGSDSFRINFIIDGQKLKSAEQGTYRGRLIYRLQEEGREQIIPVDIEIGVEKVFDMKITSEGLSFYNLKPGTPTQEKIVLIDVQSNLQAPYQISQMISRPLTDTEGNTIAAEYFSMREELLEGEGEAMFIRFEPVEMGEKTVFLSGDKGENVSLRIIYRLTPSIDILAGDYSTSVTYSLSEK